MKFILSICILLIVKSAMTYPQSSFYASNRQGSYPQLLPRFGGSDDVANRFGENGDNSTSPPASTTTTAASNPSDSIHDPVIVNRVATWPKDRQPFWFINSQHINSQRGLNVPCTNCDRPQQSAQQPMPQSPFAGNS